MRELVFELLLRLIKPIAALAVGALVWLVASTVGGATASAELAILSWLAGAAFILLASDGPI